MYSLADIKSEVNTIMRSVHCSTLEVTINNRLSRSLGRCVYAYNRNTRKYSPIRIEFSSKFLASATNHSVYDVIQHECAHAITTIRHPYSTPAHDAFFRATCAEIGCVANRATYQVDTKDNDSFYKYKYLVFCPNCGCIGEYSRNCKTLDEIRANKRQCAKCHSRELTIQTN